MENFASHLTFIESKDLDSIRGLIGRQYEDLKQREHCFSLKEKQFMDFKRCIDECNKVFEFKKNELSNLNNRIDRYNVAMKLKEREFNTAQQKLGNLSNDIKLKERELHVVRNKNDDCEEKLKKIMELIEERSKERALNETERVSKERDLESVRTLIKEQEGGLATKMKQYDAIQMAIKDSSKELALKRKELESIQNMIATILKEKRLDTLEKTIKLQTEQLDFKEKELGLMLRKSKDLSEDLLFKESELDSIKLCINEHSKELDMLENQLINTQNSIKDCHIEVICFAENLSSIGEAIIECSKECESKENLFDSLQTFVDSNKSASMEKQHNSISVTVTKCIEGLKVQKEHFYLLRKSIEDRLKKVKIKENELEQQTVELNKKDEKVSKILKEIELAKVEVDSQMKLLQKGEEERRLEEKQCNICTQKLESKEKEESDTMTFHKQEVELGRALCIANKSPVDNTGLYYIKTEHAESSPANKFLDYKSNYVMNKMALNPSQIFNELQTYESITMKDKNKVAEVNVATVLGGSNSGTKKRKSESWKKKNKDKTVAGPTKKQKKEVKVAKGKCFHCNVDGHWKRNCPKYLEEIKKEKEGK